MKFDSSKFKTGADYIGGYWMAIFFVLLSFAIGSAMKKSGMVLGIIVIALPLGLIFIGWILSNAYAALIVSLYLSFFSAGITRYVAGPWGLMMDFTMFFACLAVLFKKFRGTDWSPLKNDIMKVCLVWYGLVVFELINPESNGPECWFYAMRAAGFYNVLGFFVVFMTCDKEKHLDIFIDTVIGISVVGTIWGMRQQIGGVDDAEYRWLYIDGYWSTHVLFGVLRVFSFYSDAGQFGSSQAMVAMMCFIMALSPVSKPRKIYLFAAGLLTFWGYAISGTRGAIAVPAAGGLTFLFLSRNFKVLAIGVGIMGAVFVFMKYTTALQNVEQVRRMRTALNPEDASLLTRLKNQKKIGKYLLTRPIGGGIGSAGFWGSKYNPWTVLGSTPTDSYYVKIWGETGIIGICLHLFMFGYFLARGGNVVWHLKHPIVRAKAAAITAAMAGIFAASYGNQVYSQMPTGLIMSIAIPFAVLCPKYELERFKNGDLGAEHIQKMADEASATEKAGKHKSLRDNIAS